MPSTIRDLTELTTIAADDYLLISDTSDVTNRDKRISRANLLSSVMYLDVAQTVTAVKTHSVLIQANAGINFGGTTFSQYSQGTWTPVDGSGAALTLTTAIGRYTRIGRMAFATFAVGYPATADASTAVISGLPYTPLAIISTTGGGGFLFATSLLFPTNVLVTTGAVMLFTNANTNVGLKNSDMTSKFARGWVMYDI